MAKVYTARCGKTEMRYAVFGSGEKAFVILPGVFIGHITDSANGVEKQFMKYLDRYRFYLFDRREKVPSGYTMDNMAEDTVDIINFLKIKNADIYGVSQGGMMALLIAENHPELIDHLILGSAAIRNTPLFVERCNTWIKMTEEKDSKGIYESYIKWMFTDSFIEKFYDSFMEKAPEYSDEEFAQFERLVKAFFTVDIEKKIGNVNCPTLAMGGKKDNVFTIETTKEIKEKTGCEMYIYPDYGHGVYDESPDFIDRIMRFAEK